MTPHRFEPGQRVRVRAADPPGHVRTPHYTRGHFGVIESRAGSFANPEELAYGRGGEPLVPLYRVRFQQKQLWPDYAGAPHDTVVVDIYEHWLESAEPKARKAARPKDGKGKARQRRKR
jgi:nitrile hydratase